MLTNAVDHYLDVRRAAGFLMNTHERLLRNYARYSTKLGDTHVRTETAIDWAVQGASPAQQYYRLRMVALFARFMRAEDPLHEEPSLGAIPSVRRQRLVPYIYSGEEIRRVLIEASLLGPTGSLRPLTYTTLFGLLAATGLRISEALALHLDDLTPDGLVVRESKFRKSRLVVLHGSTATALDAYVQRRRTVGRADEHLFVSLRGRGFAYSTVIATFLRIVRKLGLHPGPGKKGPRLHDMRHTFAATALENCPRDRDGIARHMLALSTYLGHTRLADTYWYLEATPRLKTCIADDCEALFEGGRR